MLRRISLVLLLVMSLVPTAWAKFKDEDQQYLDENFKKIQAQVNALGTQLQSLNKQLVDLSQAQAALQAFIMRQQRTLDDMDQMVTSMHLSGETDFSDLKAAIKQLRSDTQAAFAKLTGQPVPTAGGGEAVAVPRLAIAPKAIQDYITSQRVEGNTLTVGLGSRRGITAGQRLVVFKANDPNTQVAVIEVSQVLDAESSRCTVIQKNPGVELVFGDVVRVQ